MHFRPCIDIHNGKVKQIVGGSLTDQGNQAKENFTASENADYYAKIQKDFRWAVESMPKMQKSFWRRGQAM